MKNDYEIRGDVTAIFIDSNKYGNKEALINTSALEIANEFPNSWYLYYEENIDSFYVYGNLSPITVNGKRPLVMLHRWITKCPKGMVVDHEDHNPLNNTDKNLRIVTVQQNNQNKKGSYSNSSSGIRGVSWHKQHNKWCSKIRINRKDKHIGYFEDIKDAEHAVIEARMRYMPFSSEASL